MIKYQRRDDDIKEHIPTHGDIADFIAFGNNIVSLAQNYKKDFQLDVYGEGGEKTKCARGSIAQTEDRFQKTIRTAR